MGLAEDDEGEDAPETARITCSTSAGAPLGSTVRASTALAAATRVRTDPVGAAAAIRNRPHSAYQGRTAGPNTATAARLRPSA